MIIIIIIIIIFNNSKAHFYTGIWSNAHPENETYKEHKLYVLSMATPGPGCSNVG